MRRGDFNFDKVCSDSKGGKGKANDEWVYSGSIMNKRQCELHGQI